MWRTPPVTETPSGELRRVGVEIEFAGLDVRAAANVVRDTFGGTVDVESRFVATVRGTELGDFGIEMDAKFLTNQSYLSWIERLGVEMTPTETDRVEDLLESMSSAFVPCEVVTPPISLDRLGALDALERGLVDAQAEGTWTSWRHAFGVHLNPELPGHSANSLLAHLKAFIASYDQLLERMDVDVARRIAPWIDRFPESYVRLIFADGYAPDRRTLVRDYLTHNPTRNRPLDMLPAFKFLEPDLVEDELEDELIKARPTFHYRLPNSDLGRPGWSIAREWNRWVDVEEVAAGDTWRTPIRSVGTKPASIGA